MGRPKKILRKSVLRNALILMNDETNSLSFICNSLGVSRGVLRNTIDHYLGEFRGKNWLESYRISRREKIKVGRVTTIWECQICMHEHENKFSKCPRCGSYCIQEKV